jgi:serine/threonine-protein phosphatase 5
MNLPTDSEQPPPDSATVNGTSTSEQNPEPPSSSSELQLPISWPQDGKLTIEWIQNLTLCFDWSSKNLPPSEFPSVLPVHVFDSLILIASKMLHKEPNCVPIQPFRHDPDSSSSSAASVVVVGDVHGQLHDLLFLLRDAGYPSKDRIFVFNGDYVDRGAWGLETFLLLLAWKVKKKHFFFLLLVKLRFFNFYLFIYFCMKIFNSWILCLLLLY